MLEYLNCGHDVFHDYCMTESGRIDVLVEHIFLMCAAKKIVTCHDVLEVFPIAFAMICAESMQSIEGLCRHLAVGLQAG